MRGTYGPTAVAEQLYGRHSGQGQRGGWNREVPGMAVLECAQLTRRFGDRVAVSDVSFEVAPGETYGLLGPNGAGKTTTIRMVCGLLAPDAGSVTVAGRPMRGDGLAARAQIGYVPQEVALYPDLSARENLRFFGRMYRLRGRELAGRIDEVLELVNLADRGDDRVETYSGGMRRRLNIGTGLLHRPALLVLDEPTVGVDPQSRHAILDSVRRFGEGGLAVLYTTHYMEEAERICDRVGIIDRGRLIAEGTRRELVAKLAERDRIELVATGDLAAFAAACRRLDGVAGVDATDGHVHLLTDDGRRLLPRVLETAERSNAAVRSVEVVEPDLEAVFLHLTGTALRE
ncbi:MAG TPA: ABC transporter ATP-binding protein [Pseudonocardiaceae bacterium]|nr:ABC transporter ATP-binding protein [Pseudonocardiaceae bacterium]